jgi:hypothetical protein
MSLAIEIEQELSRRFDAAAMLLEENWFADDASTRRFAMFMEVNEALRDTIVRLAHEIDNMSPGVGN